MSYGTITVGFGSPEQRDLEVVDFVKCRFPGDRVVHVAKIEDGSYTVTIENLPSSGRAGQQTMRLSEESLIAIQAGIQMYQLAKGIDSTSALNEFQKGKPIEFSYSDNIDPKLK